jgi:hypothetical protein
MHLPERALPGFFKIDTGEGTGETKTPSSEKMQKKDNFNYVW